MSPTKQPLFNLQRWWCPGFDPALHTDSYALPQIRCVGQSYHHNDNYHIYAANRKQDEFNVFQFTLSGCGRFHNRTQSRNVPAGSGFLCKANEAGVHYHSHTEEEIAWSFIFITWYGLGEQVSEITQHDPIFQLDLDDPILSQLWDWSHYSEKGRILTTFESADLIFRLLAKLCKRKNNQENSHSHSPKKELYQRFLDILNSHAHLQLSSQEIAQLLHCSREHLSRTVQKQSGLTLQILREKARLRAATEMLIQSNQSIQNIAKDCGFHDSSHLNAKLRKRYHCNASTYRQRLRDGNDWSAH